MENDRIEEITEELKSDERNRSYTERGITPIFQINKEAKVLIIGQAPGKKVEESGIPFHDKSGERLMDWMGIDPETFYSEQIAIMPMDFYYPGKAKTGDLPPRSFIAREYHKQIREAMPEVSLTLLSGSYSVHYYLKGREKKNLTETVKAFQEYLPDYFPIVHPSPLNNIWLKKNPWFEEEVVPELRERVCAALNQPAE
ncbi:MAG: uracil-DNA glycosylase family protein [Clostridiales bacterium]|jgi:uracil-DNA glycosylase|nr:uracil-DNA glycosylase family protein [Clostridiales bacterium]